MIMKLLDIIGMMTLSAGLMLSIARYLKSTDLSIWIDILTILTLMAGLVYVVFKIKDKILNSKLIKHQINEYKKDDKKQENKN